MKFLKLTESSTGEKRECCVVCFKMKTKDSNASQFILEFKVAVLMSTLIDDGKYITSDVTQFDRNTLMQTVVLLIMANCFQSIMNQRNVFHQNITYKTKSLTSFTRLFIRKKDSINSRLPAQHIFHASVKLCVTSVTQEDCSLGRSLLTVSTLHP